MPEAGFFAQKQRSPTSLALVVLLHGALIAAVILIKSPTFIHAVERPLVVTLDPDDQVPPPDPPPQPQQPQHVQERIDQPQTVIQPPPTGPAFDTRPQPTRLADNTAGSSTIDIPVLPPPPPPPLVRRAAQIDPSSQLQPPYPPSEYRAQRDGRVQVRVTIGPDGRVTDVARISATSDAFWEVTRQQALRHWRFRPATVDGRPVEETRVMSLIFRIVDAG